MTTVADKQIELELPFAGSAIENGWRHLAIPVSQLGLTAEDAKIKEVMISTDEVGEINIGLIRVTMDKSPLQVLSIADKTVPRGDRYKYTASASGGKTPLVYTWDFDSSDGLQAEADGKTIVHAFQKPGNYTVTVTVADVYGAKKPVVTRFKVHVTP